MALPEIIQSQPSAVFRLVVLGTVDLRSRDGDEVTSILTQPKRVALLVYLASASPRGFHRRDTLLGLLWPELDMRRARAALNKGIHYLRSALGAGAIASRGDEEIALVGDHIWSDVAAFEAALDAGRYEDALALYQGDLLPGFFVPDAIEFERWLDRERERLRARAVSAARELAERADYSQGVVRWTYRALSLAPDDEALLRWALGLFDSIDDDAAALQAYEQFARRLRAELEAEPSPSTAALMAGIRARAAEAARSSMSSHAPHSEPDAATLTRRTAIQEEDEAAAVTPRARRRLSPVAIATLVGIALLVIAPIIRTRFQAPVASSSSVVTIAVLPFSVRGDPALSYLGEGMVDLLGAKLNGAGALSTIDPSALLGFLDREPGVVGPVRGAVAARHFGARYFILGSVVGNGGNAQVSAALYDVAATDGSQPLARASVEGASDQLFPLIDDLTRHLLSSWPGGPSADMERLAANTTVSLPALRAFLEGESEFRAGRYPAAVQRLQDAVRLDSTFALAYYRLSSASTWAERADLSKLSADRALAHSERLPPNVRMVLEARLRHQHAQPEEAERRLLAVLGDQPHMVEAWYYLAEVRAHWSSVLARPMDEADSALRRALTLAPAQVGLAIHLARLAALRGDDVELDSLATIVLRAEPATDQAREIRALRAVAHGDVETIRLVADELRTARDAPAFALVQSIAAHGSDPAAARTLSGALVAREHASWVRAQAQLLRARLAAEEGRWRAASAALNEASDVSAGPLLEYRVFLATLPFAPTTREELLTLRTQLDRAPTDAAATHVSQQRWPTDPLTAGRRLYLLSLLDLRVGDTTAAVAHAAQLERLPSASAGVSYEREFAASARAALALARGRASDALSALGPPTVGADSVYPSAHSYPRAQARWLRAEALRVLGRYPEALRVYASFPDPESYDIPYVAPALRRRAELLRRQGDATRAAALEARAARLWQQADAGTQLPP